MRLNKVKRCFNSLAAFTRPFKGLVLLVVYALQEGLKSNWLILKMMMWALTRCRERCYGIMGNVGSSIFRSLTFTVLSLPHSTASWRQVLYFLPTTLQLFASFSYFADSDDYILNIHKIINNDISRSLFLFKFESPLASEMYGKVWKPIWYIKKIYENVALMK